MVCNSFQLRYIHNFEMKYGPLRHHIVCYMGTDLLKLLSAQLGGKWFFFFFWLDPLCASPFGPLCNTSGEAGIRGMPCGFMFCMSHSD